MEEQEKGDGKMEDEYLIPKLWLPEMTSNQRGNLFAYQMRLGRIDEHRNSANLFAKSLDLNIKSRQEPSSTVAA